jgi:fatty acid desaturase
MLKVANDKQTSFESVSQPIMDNAQNTMLDNENENGPSEEKPGRPGAWRRAGRFVFRFLLFVVLFFVVLVIGQLLVSTLSLGEMETFRQKLTHADRVLVFVRLGLIALLIVYWQPFNTWLAKTKGWSDAQLGRILSGRWMALAVLLFVEFIMVQRFHELLM